MTRREHGGGQRERAPAAANSADAKVTLRILRTRRRTMTRLSPWTITPKSRPDAADPYELDVTMQRRPG